MTRYLILSILIGILALSAFAMNLSGLYTRVENFGVGTQGYEIGKVLTPEQKQIARENPESTNLDTTYKFRDGDLHVTADKQTDRVLVLYRYYDDIDRRQLQELVGSTVLEMGPPSTIAHDKIYYWVYTDQGLVNEDEFEDIRDFLRTDNPIVTAYMKLDSTHYIHSDTSEITDGEAHILWSSTPLLDAYVNQ